MRPALVRTAPRRQASLRPAPLPRGYQHPLRVYEELITAVEAG